MSKRHESDYGLPKTVSGRIEVIMSLIELERPVTLFQKIVFFIKHRENYDSWVIKKFKNGEI